MSILPMSRTRKSRRGDRGQATVEFVLVLPFLLFFFFLVLDFGWLLKNWIVVTNAAREATRCAVVNDCSYGGTAVSPAQLMQDRITQGVTGNLTNINNDVHYVDQNGDGQIAAGDSIVVCVKADNVWITPIMQILGAVTKGALPSPMPLAAREEMRLEVAQSGTVTTGGESCSF